MLSLKAEHAEYYFQRHYSTIVVIQLESMFSSKSENFTQMKETFPKGDKLVVSSIEHMYKH